MSKKMETIEDIVDAFKDEYEAIDPAVDNIDNVVLARITLHWKDRSGHENSRVALYTWRGDTEYIVGQLCKRLRKKALISKYDDEYIQIGKNMSIDVYVRSAEDNASNIVF